MSDFWTLTNKDEVMDFLDWDLDMTDDGYSVVKQDKTAIAEVINQTWKDDIEAYLDHSWGEIKHNILQELVAAGYLKEDDR